MHIIEPVRYQPQPRRRHWWLFALPPLLLLIAGMTANYLRPLPVPTATLTLTMPAAAGSLHVDWPADGQAAIGAAGYGLLDTHGDQTPLATASIAKVIVALCVLEKQPLKPGESGPTYTIGPADVASYNHYAAIDGSLIPVTLGEQLTEYQALEAIMLPSANNIADSLVTWVFGSQTAYAAYATGYLQRHGLNQTHVGSDASGFDPSTASTASDLTALGLLALQSPVLLNIANQRSTTLPVVGLVYNYNTILGVNGITGLKTGNNDADPGAFLFTATAHIGDKDIPLTGAVMGAADLDTALQDSAKLAASLRQGFEQVVVAHAGQRVGSLQSAWGAASAITPAKDITIVRWKAVPVSQTNHIDASVRSGTVGKLKVTAGQAASETPLKLARPLPGPSFWWRLTRH